MQLRVVRPDAGEALPDADRLDGLVVLGGTMSVRDVQDHPWLTAERELLDAAVAQGVPTLAVCLGAQQLAVARGGQVEVGAPTGPERGVRSEEHTSELQSRGQLVCRLVLEKRKKE